MDPRSFLVFMARVLCAWAIKGRKKNSVHNLPYGPRTRLIRGMYCIVLYWAMAWVALHFIVLYYIILYCIVLYRTVLYCTVLYCIALYVGSCDHAKIKVRVGGYDPSFIQYS